MDGDLSAAGESGPTSGDVAGYLMLRHHSAVGLVDRAVKAGLVERQEDAGDRRIVRVGLTPLGEHTRAFTGEIRRILANVSGSSG